MILVLPANSERTSALNTLSDDIYTLFIFSCLFFIIKFLLATALNFICESMLGCIFCYWATGK